MKKWQLENNEEIKSTNTLIEIILKNRGIIKKGEIDKFLNPKLSDITLSSVKINKPQLEKALKRINKAIKLAEKIIIYGDYDVDGICASAILWETLHSLGADVTPYIPSRFEEGYGLSIRGIENLSIRQAQEKIENCSLIITVDNGIVANEAVDYANKKGIDVIITDHHVPPTGGSKKLPKAFSIVHTTSLCGAGVAYLLSQAIKNHPFGKLRIKIKNHDGNHLELVTLATIADLVPLTGANRILVHFGLLSLRETKRPGLLALINDAGIKRQNLGVYEIGHIIAPRLNAMGRLSDAMDSLRLLCTKDKERAKKLSLTLSKTNFQRQQVTLDALTHARNKVTQKEIKNLIFIADESYQQGVIGLVAGRLVEEYYLPSIVISKGKKYSKASARSVKGFNIIEFIRTASDLLVDVGGHPMAAGFTVENTKLELLEKKLFESAKKLLKKKHLERKLRIDVELPVSLINEDTYSEIQKLAPFGMANPESTFLTRDMIIESMRLVGNDGNHLKFNFQFPARIATQSVAGGSIFNFQIQGIYFGAGENNKFSIGDNVDVVYTLSENVWNGNKTLQLKIKDLKES